MEDNETCCRALIYAKLYDILTIKHGAKDALGGSVRRIGWTNFRKYQVIDEDILTLIKAKHKVGAATLLSETMGG